MSRKIRLLYDNHLRYGSKEHFFHFLWGYLFPSISMIIEGKNDKQFTDKIYYFDTCGPLMDKVINEVIKLLSLNAEIVSKAEVKITENKLLVPRWDLYLLRDYIIEDQSNVSHIANFKNCTYLKHFLSSPNFLKNFTEKIREIRTTFFRHVVNLDLGTNPILLLKRSNIHPFYTNQGNAEIKGYGKSRRGLSELNNYIDRHANKNIRAYEAGKHSLSHQIISFFNSSGIIGIKGAEFANLIWLKEGAKVVMIRPHNMKTPNIQQKLSEILNLNFIELISYDGNYPSVLELDPIKYFNEHS